MDLPYDLLDAFDPKGGLGVIAFVGSGPSINCGLPSWPDLLREVAIEVGLEADVRSSLKDNRFLDVAQYLARSRSEAAVQEKVSSILRRGHRPPGALHRGIVEVPFSGIITTNYDLLLSDADERGRFSRPISHRTSPLFSHLQRQFAFHLLGHIDDPASIVVTKSSYDRFSAGINREAVQFMRTVFQTHLVLFLGFGFRDQNVDMILREMQDMGAVSEWSVFASVPVPDPASPDKVLESALRYRSVNPIFLAEGRDYGAEAMAGWLGSVSRATGAIRRARLRPFIEEPQWSLASDVKRLLSEDDYQPHIRKAIGELVDRPDLKRFISGRFDEFAVTELLGRIDLHEAGYLFVELNRSKRSPSLEKLLS